MTSLREAFQKAAKAAVDAIGDIAVSANYLSHSTTTYNASSGAETTTFSTIAGVKVVFADFRIAEIDGQIIRPEDKKALVPAMNISGITPGVSDRIVADTSITWEVQNVRLDPAGAIHKLQIRRP